jgi:hypothetical protein
LERVSNRKMGRSFIVCAVPSIEQPHRGVDERLRADILVGWDHVEDLAAHGKLI